MVAMHGRHAAIRLGDDDRVGPRRGHGEDRDEQVRGADAAIAADGERLVVERRRELDQRRRGDAHHRLAGGVEARRQRERHADLRRRARRGAHLLERRHGLDPDDVGAALLQPLDLLDEDVDRLVLGERPERGQEVAGRPDRAGDDHRPVPPHRRPRAHSRRRAGRARACDPARLCSASRRRLQPNELVRMMSAPASTKLWCSARIRSGWVSFHRSGASPEVRPMLKRLVPVAPSARRTGRDGEEGGEGGAHGLDSTLLFTLEQSQQEPGTRLPPLLRERDGERGTAPPLPPRLDADP